jgi:HK97 family phage portal protein
MNRRAYRPLVLDGPPPESRSIENPTVKVSASNFLEFFGVTTADLPSVTVDSALTVPTFAAAVGFLSRSLANLPLHVYRAGPDNSAERLTGKLQRVLNEAPNPDWTSFSARQYFWQQVFSRGRGLFYIERVGANPDSLWPMDPAKTTVKRTGFRKTYTFGGKTYEAADVVDVPFMLKSDQLGVYSPLKMGAPAIQLALAMTKYGAGFFAGGGVPPLALSGPLPQGADALRRAQADVKRAIDGAKTRGEAILPIPAGHTLSPVGFDPAKGQMVEAQRFMVEEIARPFNLPPVFVGDLTHGTFSNTEQQDLQLVKHAIAHWAKALEEELNLKLFGAHNNRRFVEHNLDGLMRGDFKTRMEGLAQGVQNALLTPNEARALDNRKSLPNGDKLMIQGATVPLGTQPKDGANAPAEQGGADEPRDPDADPDA